MTVRKQIDIDNKHSMYIDVEEDRPRLAKRTVTGELQPIPEDEPTILFRGRDKLAVPMLQWYRQQCHLDGATEYQLASIDSMIKKFQKFAEASPTMKQPGCTRGL